LEQTAALAHFCPLVLVKYTFAMASVVSTQFQCYTHICSVCINLQSAYFVHSWEQSQPCLTRHFYSEGLKLLVVSSTILLPHAEARELKGRLARWHRTFLSYRFY